MYPVLDMVKIYAQNNLVFFLNIILQILTD